MDRDCPSLEHCQQRAPYSQLSPSLQAALPRGRCFDSQIMRCHSRQEVPQINSISLFQMIMVIGTDLLSIVENSSLLAHRMIRTPIPTYSLCKGLLSGDNTASILSRHLGQAHSRVTFTVVSLGSGSQILATALKRLIRSTSWVMHCRIRVPR